MATPPVGFQSQHKFYKSYNNNYPNQNSNGPPLPTHVITVPSPNQKYPQRIVFESSIVNQNQKIPSNSNSIPTRSFHLNFSSQSSISPDSSPPTSERSDYLSYSNFPRPCSVVSPRIPFSPPQDPDGEDDQEEEEEEPQSVVSPRLPPDYWIIESQKEQEFLQQQQQQEQEEEVVGEEKKPQKHIKNGEEFELIKPETIEAHQQELYDQDLEDCQFPQPPAERRTPREGKLLKTSLSPPPSSSSSSSSISNSPSSLPNSPSSSTMTLTTTPSEKKQVLARLSDRKRVHNRVQSLSSSTSSVPMISQTPPSSTLTSTSNSSKSIQTLSTFNSQVLNNNSPPSSPTSSSSSSPSTSSSSVPIVVTTISLSDSTPSFSITTPSTSSNGSGSGGGSGSGVNTLALKPPVRPTKGRSSSTTTTPVLPVTSSLPSTSSPIPQKTASPRILEKTGSLGDISRVKTKQSLLVSTNDKSRRYSHFEPTIDKTTPPSSLSSNSDGKSLSTPSSSSSSSPSLIQPPTRNRSRSILSGSIESNKKSSELNSSSTPHFPQPHSSSPTPSPPTSSSSSPSSSSSNLQTPSPKPSKRRSVNFLSQALSIVKSDDPS